MSYRDDAMKIVNDQINSLSQNTKQLFKAEAFEVDLEGFKQKREFFIPRIQSNINKNDSLPLIFLLSRATYSTDFCNRLPIFVVVYLPPGDTRDLGPTSDYLNVERSTESFFAKVVEIFKNEIKLHGTVVGLVLFTFERKRRSPEDETLEKVRVAANDNFDFRKAA